MDRSDRYRVWVVCGFLIALHFLLGPWLGRRVAPDFLLLALMVYSIRARPGAAAIAGFLLGLVGDALTTAPGATGAFGVPGIPFGSGVIAYTVVGYLSAWGKAVFFADNLVVNGGFFFGGVWLRDLLLLVSSASLSGGALLWHLAVWSVVRGLTTALVGITILLVFRNWLNVRITD